MCSLAKVSELQNLPGESTKSSGSGETGTKVAVVKVGVVIIIGVGKVRRGTRSGPGPAREPKDGAKTKRDDENDTEEEIGEEPLRSNHEAED